MASTILSKMSQQVINSGADTNKLFQTFLEQFNKSGKDPNTVLQQLLSSGKVSKQQLDEAIKKARAFQNIK